MWSEAETCALKDIQIADILFIKIKTHHRDWGLV